MFSLSELGQRLKQAREEKHLSLDDLQKSTKIQKRYLMAIERGDFNSLPGKFYARAFVKNYAEAVGLDSEELLHEFGKELPNPHKEVSDIPSRSVRTKNEERPKPSTKSRSIIPAFVGTVVIVGILVGVWYVLMSGGGTAMDDGVTPDEQELPFEGELPEEIVTDPEPDQMGDNVEDNSETPEPVVEDTREQQLVLKETSGNTSYYTLTGTERFEAEIILSGRSYVRVRNGKGREWFAGEPAQDAVLTYDLSSEEEIEFNFGASPFVTLLINGEEVEYPLDVVHQKVVVTFN